MMIKYKLYHTMLSNFLPFFGEEVRIFPSRSVTYTPSTVHTLQGCSHGSSTAISSTAVSSTLAKVGGTLSTS